MCDQLVCSSWTGWHQGEVSSITSLLFPTSVWSMCCGQQLSSGGGPLPVKITRLCQSDLCIFQGNWEFGNSVCLVYILNCCQFPGPIAFLFQFSCSVVSNSAPHGLQHARPPCPSPTPGAYSDSCPSSR